MQPDTSTRAGSSRRAITLACAALAAACSLPFLSSASAARLQDQENPIAVCAVPTLVNELMTSARFADPRQELLDSFDKQLEELEAEITEIREAQADPDPTAPEVREVFNRFNELNIRREREMAALSARQLVEAYTMARAAARDIAEEQGFDYVIAAASEDEKLPDGNPELTLRQMLARPCLLWPDGCDITEDVREDLNL